MKIVKTILPEMDKAVALAARQLMQTAAYGNLLSAGRAEHRAFVASGQPGQLVEIRSTIMALKSASVEIKVTVQQEKRPGRIKKYFEAYFTFVLLKSMANAPASASPDELFSFSGN